MTGEDLLEEYETYVSTLRELRSARQKLSDAQREVSSGLTHYHSQARLAGLSVRIRRIEDRVRAVTGEMDWALYDLQARVWQDRIRHTGETFEEWRDSEFDRLYDD